MDDFVIAVKSRDALRRDACHTIDHPPARAAHKRIPPPRRERVFVVVHRYNEKLYYKRIEEPAVKILGALHTDITVAHAVAAGGARLSPAQVQEWFSTWSELGWFCRR